MRHQNSVFQQMLKHLPWAVFDRQVAALGADARARHMDSKTQLVALLYAQFSGAQSLREIEAGLQSHAGQLYHLGIATVSRSTLAEANACRPAAVFVGLFSALAASLPNGARRQIGQAVRLIDSTGLRLSALSGKWASFSAGVFGAKGHIIYDPDADRPLYLAITPANVNDITAAKAMPIEPAATYVFDLGYYDFGWWARLDAAGCCIVSRLKSNTPLAVIEERAVPAGTNILSDRIGYLPKRMAMARKNPMSGAVREVRVQSETGKILRIFTNNLTLGATEVAALYKRRWAIELFFRWVKQTLKIRHFLGTSENAVRIQITVALIAFLLLRAVQAACALTLAPLAFARLIRANIMHRRDIARLQQPPKTPPDHRQFRFTFQTKTNQIPIQT